MKKAIIIVFLGLLIALEVIFTRFLSFQTTVLRISFGFLPIAAAAIIFGPVAGGLCGALADVIGMLIFPRGAYFPGLTLSAFATGFIYGIFLHKKAVTTARIIMASVIITVFVDILLNTYWLSIITGNPFSAIILPRTVKNLAMMPLQVVLISAVWRLIIKRVAGKLVVKPNA